MNLLKKLLILLMVALAMYGTYQAVEYLKKKINGRKSLGNFLLLFFLSFGVVFLVILFLGWIIGHYRDFFFKP